MSGLDGPLMKTPPSQRSSMPSLPKHVGFNNPVGDEEVGTPGTPGTPRSNRKDDGWSVFNSPGKFKPGTKVPKQVNGTPFSSIVSISATAMGAGILSLPEAVSRCGLFPGLALIIFFGVLADFSLVFLVECSRASGRRSFEGVSVHYLGRLGATAIKVALIVLLFFSLVLLIIVAGKLFGTPLRYFLKTDANEWYTQNEYVSLFSAIIILPLSLVREISFLKYTSFFGCMFLFYLVIDLIVKMASSPVDPSWTAGRWKEDTFLSVPVVMSAFCCQFNIFKIEFELQTKYKKHMNTIIHGACALVTSMYCLGGGIGFLLLGEDIKNHENPDDLLSMFPGDTAMLVGSGLIGLTNLLKIPLIVLPFRSTAFDILGRKESKASFITILAMTIVTMAICAGLAVGLKSISKVLGLIGSTAGVMVVLILPGALYLKASNEPKKRKDDRDYMALPGEEKINSQGSHITGSGCIFAFKRLVAWLMVFIGVFAGIGSLGLTIALWNDS